MSVKTLEDLLHESSVLHRHLCPRQVLGVRMSLFAGEILGLTLPQTDKRLLTIVEIDGCFSDGVAVATNCWVGHRTMRIQDYGKIAATFIDTRTRNMVRLSPSQKARVLALEFAPEATSRWEAYLLGYQRIPLKDLFNFHEVDLSMPIDQILSRPDHKVICEICGEEIFNEREIRVSDRILCHACANGSYYRLAPKLLKVEMTNE